MANIKDKKYKIINFEGKSNYHTHTGYCDGINSPREMVERALELGFESLGFSGHQYSVQDANYAMSPSVEVQYRSDVLQLRDEYKDKLNIYLGIERDYCCEATSGFQYVIGSTHHVLKDGIWMNADEDAESMDRGVQKLFDGDYMAYAEAYYDLESRVLTKTKGQIVGHFDLVSVFNGDGRFFDEEDPAYQRLALSSAEAIVEKFISDGMAAQLPPGFPEELGEAIVATGMPIFEVNTGAMVKKRRSVPYPAPFIIEKLADIGVPLLLNSDCHDSQYLDYGFKDFAVNHNM